MTNFWDFTDYTDVIIDGGCSGGQSWIADANPAAIPLSSSYYESLYVEPTLSIESFVAYARVKSTSMLNAQNLNMFIISGSQGVYLGPIRASGAPQLRLGYKVLGSGTRCSSDIINTTDYDVIATWENKWIWLKIVYKHNINTVLFYYNVTDDSTSKPNAWILLGSETITLSTVDELGILSNHFGGNNTEHFADDLEITEFVGNTITGFDASIKFESYYLNSGLNGGGNARFFTPNPYETVSVATLEAQLKKEITFNNNYGDITWRGEAGTLQVRIDGAEYEAEEITRKTMYTRVNSDPTIYSVLLRYWEGRDVIDKDAYWLDNGVEDTHIISFSKTDVKIFSTRPVLYTIKEDDFTTPFVPDHELGSGARLYYPFDENLGGVDSDQGLVLVNDRAISNERFVTRFANYIFEKYQNEIELATLYLEISYVAKDDFSNSGAGNDIEIHVYDYVNTTWEVIDFVGKDEVEGTRVNSEIADNGGFLDRGKPLPYTYDIIAEITRRNDYDDWDSGTGYVVGDRIVYNGKTYSSIQNGTNKIPTDEPTYWRLMIYDFLFVISAASADDEFTQYEFQFAIQAADHSGLPPLGGDIIQEHNGFWLFEAKTTFAFLNDNEPEYSTTSINTVSQDTINSDAVSGFDLPEEDGFGADDVIVISKSAKDYIEDAYAASDLPSIAALDFQVTGADNFALTDDYTYQTFFDLLQDICSNLNATWWFDYSANSIVVRSVDLLTDSGIIIQASDLVGWDLGQWSIDYDATTQRTKGIVIGDNVVVEQDYSPKDIDGDARTFDLGDEVDIITDSSIQTPTQGRNLLLAKQPIRENAAITVRFTLDYNANGKDYSALKQGDLITVQWPTTGSPTIADFSGSDKLMVIRKEHNVNDETGYSEHVSITAQWRYS